MKKALLLSLFVVSLIVAGVGMCVASEEPASAGISAANNLGKAMFFTGAQLAAALGLGIAAAGCGIAQGIAVGKAVEGVARQPQESGKIQTLMLIGLAIIESLTIYALVIALILIYANPFKVYFAG
ncbi:MAG: ATP synthase F0 subunit C [Endomicrobiales bacterium]|nr:ATP synthase F0 subunit C [Endomicrobiales bacterium]